MLRPRRRLNNRPSLSSLRKRKKDLATEEPQTGTITGQIAYPSEFLPPQRVIAFDANDPSTYFAVEVLSGGSYNLDVPTGTYYVLAYLIDPASLGATPGLFAAYSEMVLCGLQYGCEDHSLVPVEVSGGQTVADIDPVDWYLLPGQDAGWPDDPLQTGTGTITGNLGFPSEYIPPLRVVAFDVYSSDYYFVDTELKPGDLSAGGLTRRHLSCVGLCPGTGTGDERRVFLFCSLRFVSGMLRPCAHRCFCLCGAGDGRCGPD